MWERSELKQKGKAAFKSNYWKCVLVSLILALIACAQGSSTSTTTSSDDTAYETESVTGIIEDTADEAGISTAAVASIILSVILVACLISFLIEILVKNIFKVGCVKFYIDNADSPAGLGDLISGFKNGFGRNVITMLLVDVCVALWSLLLVVPGIIKAYEYLMVPYIIADDAEISRKDAFAKSKEMMKGNKWKTFVLQLSFIGWGILSVITCGLVGIFYANPYADATMAELYLTLKENA